MRLTVVKSKGVKIMEPTIKVEIVDEKQIPFGHEIVNWPALFSGIPKGKAGVFPKERFNPDTVRAALKRYKRHGKFKSLRCLVREKCAYIVYPRSEEGKDQ